MLTVYATLTLLLSLIALFAIRNEVAYRVIMKRRARIHKQYIKRVCRNDVDALAWANEQYAAMPHYDLLLINVLKWNYSDWFEDF